MKIVFYMTTVLEYGGGLEKYLIETAAKLAEYPGLQVDVVTMDDKITDRITSGLSVFWMKKIDKSLSFKEDLEDIRRRLGKAQYYKEPSFASLRKRLQGYDVIYSKNELIEGFVLRFLLRYKTLPPIIFGGHTPIYYPNATSFHGKLHNFLYGSFIYRFLAGGVQKFHALNDSDASRFKKLFPKREVRRIYNPFDVTAFRAAARKQVYDLGTFDPEAIHILWLGRLSEQKGVSDLARIIPAVTEVCIAAGVPITWSIFGDGELRPTIEALAVSPNVTYYGHADQKYVASIYARHHVFLSTSKWEGYPYTLIESQAFGLQSFAYDIPGPRDILSVYDGGHLAANESELIDLLSTSLIGYGTPDGVPTSQPSEQFKPDVIYKQLLDFFSVTHSQKD
jgi:glycosyltransferase involved in cell wall biosynthesis